MYQEYYVQENISGICPNVLKFGVNMGLQKY